MDLSSDGYDDVVGPDRRLLESRHLADQLPPGPVRSAMLESVTAGAFSAASQAIALAQKALAAARCQRWTEALDLFVAAGAEAGEARRLPWGNAGPAVGPGPTGVRRTLGSLKGEAKRRATGEGS